MYMELVCYYLTITFSWPWGPQEMPATSLNNHDHANFFMDKLKRNMEDLQNLNDNVTHLDDLLLTSVISSNSRISKFAIFSWITSAFFKIYSFSKCLLPIAICILKMLKPAENPQDPNSMLMQIAQNPHPQPKAPHF